MYKLTTKKASENEDQLQRAIKVVKRAIDAVLVAETSEEFSVNKRTLYSRVAGTDSSAVEWYRDQPSITIAEARAI